MNTPPIAPKRWRYLDEFHRLAEVEVLERAWIPGMVPGFIRCRETKTGREIVVFKTCLLPAKTTAEA